MFNRLKMIMAVALGRMLGSVPSSVHRAAADHNRMVDTLRAAEHKAQRTPMKALRLVPRSHPKRNGYRGLNGAQAMARRVRQDRPTLWVDSQGRRWTYNSHGCPVGFGWASGPNNPRGLFY